MKALEWKSINTGASYGLRLGIFTQVFLIVLSSIPSIFRDSFRFYQQANTFVLEFIVLVLVIDMVTPASSRRRHSKKVDLISFLVWLASFSSFFIWGLTHSADL